MNKRLAFALVTTLLLSTASHAQLFRAYLASDGNDANPCNLPQPCRLLPAALAAVADGGEIWMLDSANYNTGNVAVAKSVTILAVPGAVGSFVSLGGGPALTITNFAEVSLRNVVVGPLAGAAAGDRGILVSASTLTIENSLIAGVSGHGIQAIGGGTLRVSDTTIRNATGYAIYVNEGGIAVISKTRMIDNTTGGVMVNGEAGAATGSVTGSVIAGGGVAATAMSAASGAVARLVIASSTIDRASTALSAVASGAGAVAEVTMSDNLIVNNTAAWSISGTLAKIYSRYDNQFSGNGAAVGAQSFLAGQ
jgi:hypothetical protein